VRFRGVLFDLDDTLTDRYASLEKAAEAFARKFGDKLLDFEPRAIAQAMRDTEGKGYRPRLEFFGDLIARLGWKEKVDVGSVADFWETSFAECSVEREGVTPLLTRLVAESVKLGVVTNGMTSIQQRKIDTLGVRRFLKSIVISEAAGFSKPDPRIFRLAMAELGLAPDDCAFIGDHPVNDVVGSRDAGLTAVWLAGMHAWPEAIPEPPLRISRFAELYEILGMTAQK
jgi:putative hydrolase of the HAD superfamily